MSELELQDQVVVESEAPEEPQVQEPTKEETPPSEEKVEIEVVDDTPEQDRRTPRKGEAKVDDPEDENLSSKVQKRINVLKYNYHEERRQKEEKERELAQAIDYARKIQERYRTLEQKVQVGERTLAETTQAKLDSDLVAAKRAFKEAYEAGDAEKIAEANAEIARISSRREAVVVPPKVEKQEEAPVEHQPPNPKMAEFQANRQKWFSENSTWFQRDNEMTNFAIRVHSALIENGVIPDSPAYYRIIDARMREVFPDKFGDTEEVPPAQAAPPQPKKPTSVVAPSTRSNGAPRKLVLPKSAAETARRLGVPLEEFAKFYFEGNANG